MTNILLLPQISGSLAIATDADFRASIAFVAATGGAAIDLTGITFTSKIKQPGNLATTCLALSTAGGGGLVNGGVSGILSWLVLQPALIVLAPGSYVCDIIATADGATINLCQAAPLAVTVTQGIT